MRSLVVCILGVGLLSCGRVNPFGAKPLDSASSSSSGSSKVCTASSVVPGRSGLQRLTTRQLENTLRDLLGIAVTMPASFPRDELASGYVSLPETQLMSSQFVEQQLEWILTLAAQVVSQKPALVISCDYTVSATCAEKILMDFGLRALRRPLTAAEKTFFVGQYTNTVGTPADKMKVALASVLMTPQFLYREIQNPAAGANSYLALNDYELASRLSYFVWESMPDAPLFAKAQSGELKNPDVLAAELRRMIQNTRVEGLARVITDQWLGYGALWQHSLNATSFPAFTNTMKQSMYNETVQFVKYLIQQNRPVSEMVSASYSFVDSQLAPIYAVPSPVGGGLTRTDLSTTPRQGIMGHAGYLALTSTGEKSSIVRRGLWVNDKLFCTAFGPPPANVDTSLPTTLPADSTPREVLDAHRTNPTCAACHNTIDPPGLVLEKFDPLGRYRTTYASGKTINTSTTLVSGLAFLDARELSNYLANDKKFSACVTKKLMPLAMGRTAKFTDYCGIQNVTLDKAPPDITFIQLIENITRSAMFTLQSGE